MEDVRKFIAPLIENVEHVIVGKRTAIDYIVVALLCEGHVLLSTTKVAIQAKRWTANVGSGVVRDLRGSLRVVAAEQGLTCKPSRIPSEYVATLEKGLPPAREDNSELSKKINDPVMLNSLALSNSR